MLYGGIQTQCQLTLLKEKEKWRKSCVTPPLVVETYRIELLAIFLLVLDFFSRTVWSLHIKALCLCHRHPIKACSVWSN